MVFWFGVMFPASLVDDVTYVGDFEVGVECVSLRQNYITVYNNSQKTGRY
jgi:hypothetical protein